MKQQIGSMMNKDLRQQISEEVLDFSNEQNAKMIEFLKMISFIGFCVSLIAFVVVVA